MNLHNDDIQDADKLIDDIKKKIGENRKHIEDKIDGLQTTLAQIDFENKKLLKELQESFYSIEEESKTSSERSLLAENMAKENGKNLELIPSIQNDINGFSCQLKLIESEFIESFEIQEKKCNDKYKDFNVKIDDINKICYRHANFISACEDEISDIKKDIDNLFGDISKILIQDRSTFDRIESLNRYQKTLEKLLDDFMFKYEDHVRETKSNTLILTERDRYIESVMKIMDDHLVKTVDKKDFLELKKVVDSIPKNHPKESVSSTWKEQIELKLARLEKKVHGG